MNLKALGDGWLGSGGLPSHKIWLFVLVLDEYAEAVLYA
jgi:hypothetical protein